MAGQGRTVQAATFRAWYELLEETVAHDPEEIAAGNQRRAVILLHELVAVGLRTGALRVVVIHSSGPSSFAHLMFRYTVNPEFDWSGVIALAPDAADDWSGPDRLIAELEAASGIPEHEDG